MSKRAALIITDAKFVWGNSVGDGEFDMPTSEQLLADLRLVLEWAEWGIAHPLARQEDRDAAARVRALLPEEAQDGE